MQDRSNLAILALEDGTVFEGRGFGARGTAVGEVVFNTAMTGYQEVLTDPSYCGQIVAMTSPQIGNCGVNPDDAESSKQHLSGFVVRELSRRSSNHRATGELDEYLRAAGVVGLAEIDTRALTKRLRVTGALRGAISTNIEDAEELVARARTARPMEGQALVGRVTPEGTVEHAAEGGAARFRVVAMDCGIKRNIIRELTRRGCVVVALPGSASIEAVMACRPDGILLGNGPGDPAAVTGTIETVRGLLGRVPIFGICLGHQLLALAMGAKTYKLPFGHHGSNHPVKNHETGTVEITSQNHGFAVDVESLERAGGRMTHTNLYDGSLEGFSCAEKRVFAVQYHPEAAPGPHDSRYLFDGFVGMMAGG